MYYLTNLLFFDIPLLYYYINLRSSIIKSGNIYLSLGIYLLYSFATVSELFCCKVFETFEILSTILLQIKSPVASAIFWIALFEAVLSASVSDCLA